MKPAGRVRRARHHRGREVAAGRLHLVVQRDQRTLILPNLMKSLQYDPAKDLAPISLVSYSPNLLANPAFPAKTYRADRHVKANPGKYDYGSGGVGSSQQLAMALLLFATGTKMNPRAVQRRQRPADRGAGRQYRRSWFRRDDHVDATGARRHPARARHLEPRALASAPDIPAISSVPGSRSSRGTRCSRPPARRRRSSTS